MHDKRRSDLSRRRLFVDFDFDVSVDQPLQDEYGNGWAASEKIMTKVLPSKRALT